MAQCASNKITPDALAPLILLFVPDPFFHFGIDRHVSSTPEKMDGSKHSSGLKSSGNVRNRYGRTTINDCNYLPTLNPVNLGAMFWQRRP